MMRAARDDLARVGRERGDEVGVGGGHALEAGTRLHELLPYEDAEPVAERVERLALDHPAAPHAEEVDVRAVGELEQARELLRPRHSLADVERDPVPTADVGALAVDDELVVVRELDRSKADLDPARTVEARLAHAVRPPELGIPDLEERLPVRVHAADAVLERDVVQDLRRRVRHHRTPDALVRQPRAEVPAVAHPALVHPGSAGPADLRLAGRRRVHGYREHVLTLTDLDTERRQRADVVRDLFPVDEHRRLVVDALERDRPAADARAVHPGPLRDPLGEARAAPEVDVRDLTGAHQVVDDASGHTRGEPAGRVPGLVHVPAPFLADPSFDLPAHDSSRSVSRWPTNVLISCGPKSASIVLPKTSTRACAGRPDVSNARTTQSPPSSASLTTVTTTAPPPSSA